VIFGTGTSPFEQGFTKMSSQGRVESAVHSPFLRPPYFTRQSCKANIPHINTTAAHFPGASDCIILWQEIKSSHIASYNNLLNIRPFPIHHSQFLDPAYIAQCPHRHQLTNVHHGNPTKIHVSLYTTILSYDHSVTLGPWLI